MCVCVEATSKAGKSCQSKPGSHIEPVLLNPFQSLSSKGKKTKTKATTASSTLPSFTPEKHRQNLPRALTQLHIHTHTLTQVQKACLAFRRLLLRSTQNARRVASLSTRLISASSRRDPQSKSLLCYPTIPQCCFFLPGRPTAAVCHSLCTQREPGKTTKSSPRLGS